eukprot:295313_1
MSSLIINYNVVHFNLNHTMDMSHIFFYVTIILLLLSHVISSPLSLTTTTNIISSNSSSTKYVSFSSDGSSFWRSSSVFHPIQNHQYGKIKVKKSFYMKFDLIWHGFSTNSNRPYESILRIGIPSTNVADCNGHATRYPALYLDKNAKALQFSISDHIDCWGVGLLNASYNLKINTLYTIKLHYNSSWVRIQINDDILYNNKRPGHTPSDILYKTVSVMFSDSLDPAANVTLSNIIILSYDNILTMPPTSPPTLHPIVSTNEMKTTEIIQTIQTIQTIGDAAAADTYLIEVDIYVYFNFNVNESVYFNETTIKNIFGLKKTSIIDINIKKNATHNTNTDYTVNTLHLNTETVIMSKANLTMLIAYLKNNLTRDLITHNTMLNIIQVKYKITIKQIYITSDSDDNIEEDVYNKNKNKKYFISFLPFDNEIFIYVIIGAILLCLCSFVL